MDPGQSQNVKTVVKKSGNGFRAVSLSAVFFLYPERA